MSDCLELLAREVAARASDAGCRIVLAESCTAGLVAHLLSRNPGASQWLSGSAVVYRDETKVAWLDVDAAQLADPSIGPVSRQTAAAMCVGVLRNTPEADLAVSITGHLGPDAPADLDGLVFVGALTRQLSGPADVRSSRLSAALPADSPHSTLRLHRQHEAAANVLLRLMEAILSFADGRDGP